MIPLLLLLAIGGLMQAARSFTTTIGTGGTELAFGFLLLAAYFTARVVSRLGLPKLTGYLIAGVVAGPFVLDLVTTQMGDSLKGSTIQVPAGADGVPGLAESLSEAAQPKDDKAKP